MSIWGWGCCGCWGGWGKGRHLRGDKTIEMFDAGGGLGDKKGGKNVSLRQMLGGTFMGHHGGWHREATRGVVVSDNKKHPILAGVEDVWGTSDVYRCHNDKNPFPEDCTSLVLGQPLINLEKDAPPNAKKEPLPVAWTKTCQKGRNHP